MLLEVFGDLSRILAACLLFIPFLLMPGYCLAAVFNLWEFRARSATCRTAVSITLSVAIVPIIVFLLWTQAFALVGTFYIAVPILAILLFVLHHNRIERPAFPRSLVAVAFAWCAIALLSLLDIPAAHGVYPTELSLDHSFRTEFVAAAARAYSMPPASPFFLDLGRPVPFRYHYFWFMLCGAVSRISGFHIGARHALFASIVWAGLACMAVLGLYLKLFFAYQDSLRRGLLLVGCMCAGGLQFLPFLGAACIRTLHDKPPLFWPTLTWIDLDGQIPGWVDTILWVPNHTAAFVACMAAILLLWTARDCTQQQATIHAALAGLCLASAPGLSVHVAFTFFLFFGVWTIAQLLFREWRQAAYVVLAAVVCSIAALPYVLPLLASNAAADPFLSFAIRASVFSEWLSVRAHLHGPPAQLAALITEPLVYFFELGFLLLAGWWAWRIRLTQQLATRKQWGLLLLLAATALTVSLFLSSGTGTAGTNDLGWRGMLPVQAVLLFCAVEYFAAAAPRGGGLHKLMVVLVIVGFGSTAAELATLRFYPLAVEDGLAPHTNPLTKLASGNGVYIADLRRALDFTRQTTPPTAVVQDNPVVNDSILPGLFAERQTAARGETGYRFGGSIPRYAAVLHGTRTIFEDAAQPFSDVQKACRQLGIDDLLVTSSDPLWRISSSWVWHTQPVFSDPHARVFRCSGEGSPTANIE